MTRAGVGSCRSTLNVAVLQATSPVDHDVDNLTYLSSQVAAARDLGAQLLVTPELFIASYNPPAVRDRDGAEHREQIAAMADEYGIGIVASTVEHAGTDRHISASLFGVDGTEITRYRKVHLFGEAERAAFTPGTTAPEIVEFFGVRVALGICFDVEFPEFVRAAAVAGAELLCIPTAVPLRAAEGYGANPFDARLVPAMVVPTRALESQLFIAYANHAGPQFAGLSTVADPYGRRLATADGDNFALIVAEVSMATLDQARRDTDYLANASITGRLG